MYALGRTCWYRAMHAMFYMILGPIAQLRLERTPDKREVTGSTPVRPTRSVEVLMNMDLTVRRALSAIDSHSLGN